MSNFEQLQNHVANNELRMFHIDAVPRSFATVLGRALKESERPSVYVHEPYHTMGQGVEDAAGTILSAVEPLLASSDKPPTVITKSIARKLQPGVFDAWMSVCDGVLFSIRNPNVQVHSVLERVVNDMYIAPGAARLDMNKRPDYQWDEATDFLKHGATSINFSRLGWRALKTHYNSAHKPDKVAVVDGAELINNSESVLRTICGILDIPFHERMINGWREHDIINANNSSRRRYLMELELDNSPTNGWIGQAMYSRGIEPNRRRPVDLTQLRPDLREHLTEVAQPIYESMRAACDTPPKPAWWPQRIKRYHEPPLDEEVIEHKGIAHPDTLCDLISEETHRAYIAFLHDTVGGVATGSSDKVTAHGGTANLGFGYSRITKDAAFTLSGKAMAIEGGIGYMEPLFRQVVGNVMHDVFGRVFDLEGMPPVQTHTEVRVNAGIGAEHDPAFYTTQKRVSELTDYRLSNDTVACAGWYPLTPHEQMTVALSNYINGDVFKAEFPETGGDVKILTRRLGALTTVTLCVPFIAHLTPTESYYIHRKAEIRECVMGFIKARLGSNVQVNLNTKDMPGRGYLTVYGSALDKGDNGMTGRGNRYPGLIPIKWDRPSGVEAFPGKNSFNHSGRVYTAMAFDLARLIYTSQDGQHPRSGVTTLITAQNGQRLEEPNSVTIQQNGRDVTGHYIPQIMAILGNVNDPYYTRRMSAIEAFRSCYGLLDQAPF